MQFTFAIETSKPSGSTFRMALGITIPLVLVLMALLAGLRGCLGNGTSLFTPPTAVMRSR